MLRLARAAAALFGSDPVRRGLLPAAALAAVGVALSQSTPLPPPGIPPVTLAAEPIFAGGARAKPTLTLSLSVEYPTVGAQYLNQADRMLDDTYTPANRYLGYFDTESCYDYDAGAATPHFRRTGAATGRGCGGAGFSGNYMNWATSSAIDILRLGLTGGDRVVDTESLTVLQRAVLPKLIPEQPDVTSGQPWATFFWNNIYFPAKRLRAEFAQGALPSSVAAAAGGGDVYAANCLNKVYFGSAATGSCEAPGANGSGGDFYVRVAVCGSDGSGLSDPRSGLCQRYPSGHYKPVGNLQRYSDRLRVAAFGYLQDNTVDAARYGGVLRAPMKYVGEKHYDGNYALVPGTNPKREWDTETGVFVTNPENLAEGISGVTSYLNRFGRGTAEETSPEFGIYKRYDPFGELYYESLRYLQGLPPTPEAISGLTAEMKGGFPVYTTWADPHPAVAGEQDYACIRNNILAIGDVYTHRDKSLPGNTRTDQDFARAASVSANEPDFVFWTKVVGGFESGNAVSYADGEGQTRTTSNPGPVLTDLWGLENLNPNQFDGTHATDDRNAYYIAGAAYWANTHDIRGTAWSDAARRRPGMRARTYVLDVNEAGAQFNEDLRHRRQLYLAAKYGGFRDDDGGPGNPFTASDGWENPEQPGEARTYFMAGDAVGVLRAIDTIFESALMDAKSIAGGATSSQRIAADGFVYQAEFKTATWSGDLVAYPLTLSGDDALALGDPDAGGWRAAALLDARVATGGADGRNIVVGKTTPTAVAAATPFTWGQVDADVQQALRTPLGATTASDSAATGEARLAYLRGDRSGEAPAGVFRRRTDVLGDVVNSGVVFADQPQQLFSDAQYASFLATYRNRAKALYVGANDGMLHAFAQADGQELFAYIPSWVVPKLSALSSPSYRHQAYVDSTPVVKEAKIGDGEWKTVLVGGSGGGGQGVFALDVSDPAAFGADKVLWEFTDRDDPALGNVIGAPDILKFRVTAPNAAPSWRYFAVVAGGVNNYVADGRFSASGNPAIFLLDLDKPKGTPWQEGTNYHRIELPRSVATMASGVAAFSAYLGDFDDVRRLYAGDLQGNLWKLDFGPYARGDWTSANLIANRVDGVPAPLYVAQSADGARQPITTVPTWMQGTSRQVIVTFGTGKFLEATDGAGPYATQTAYAVLDDGLEAPIAGRGRLQARSLQGDGTVGGTLFAWGRPASDDDVSVRAGWYFDFPSSAATGERSVSPATVLGGTLVFGTAIPSATVCDPGSGNEYVIDAFAGTGRFTVSEVGLFGQSLLIAVRDVDSDVGSTGTSRRTTTYRRITLGSGGVQVGEEAIDVAMRVRRLNWREIADYQATKSRP